MSTLTIIIQHNFGSPSHGNQRKEMKGIQIRKVVVKLSLFAHDMILYKENPKDATRKLLELINEFGKVAAYKINPQKSFAFLYTLTMKDQEEKSHDFPVGILDKNVPAKAGHGFDPGPGRFHMMQIN